MNMSYLTSGRIVEWWIKIIEISWLWILADPLNLLVIILIIGVGAIAVILYKQVSTTGATLCQVTIK